MRFSVFIIFVFNLFFLSCSITKEAPKLSKTTPIPFVDYQHPISFQPEQYVCYRATAPIVIDGKLEESDWNAAPATKDFVDIEGDLKPLPFLKTHAKMLWDDEYFYVAAYMEEPHIWATLTERDAVIFYDDDFEIFIDPEGDGHNYYEFEMNALNTVWDLILLKPYRVDNQPKVLNNWEIKGLQSAVHIAGTLNDPSTQDTFWSVEIAIPWHVLKELSAVPAPPKNGHQWRVNFSRVDWTMDTLNNQYTKRLRPDNKKPLPENNWVWSPQGRIAMHHPETWGYVQFASKAVGENTTLFKENSEEKIKWGLWQLHFQQVAYLKKYNRYCTDLQELTPIEIAIPNYIFSPSLENYTQGYQLIANGLGDNKWMINEKGRLLALKETK